MRFSPCLGKLGFNVTKLFLVLPSYSVALNIDERSSRSEGREGRGGCVWLLPDDKSN